MMAFKKNLGSPMSPPEDQIRLIRMLAGILDETGLTEIEIEQDGTRVRVAPTSRSMRRCPPLFPPLQTQWHTLLQRCRSRPASTRQRMKGS